MRLFNLIFEKKETPKEIFLVQEKCEKTLLDFIKYLEDSGYYETKKSLDSSGTQLFGSRSSLFASHQKIEKHIFLEKQEKRTLRYIFEIVCGLKELHDKRITHGNLKLDNILLKKILKSFIYFAFFLLFFFFEKFNRKIKKEMGNSSML